MGWGLSAVWPGGAAAAFYELLLCTTLQRREECPVHSLSRAFAEALAHTPFAIQTHNGGTQTRV
jgi:hypothetical protein